jgi:hypothetical protein
MVRAVIQAGDSDPFARQALERLLAQVMSEQTVVLHAESAEKKRNGLLSEPHAKRRASRVVETGLISGSRRTG